MVETSKRSRGKPKQYGDEELKQIALDIKYQNNGSSISYSFLEQKTGISRNTFMRRIPDFIAELNAPVMREIKLSEKDSVYFPNFELIYEVHGDNPKRLISEIRKLEDIFISTFEKLHSITMELEEFKSYKQQYELLSTQIKEKQSEATFYKNLYEQTVASSLFAHKREELGLNKTLINFKDHMSQNPSLNDLQSFFTVEDEPSTSVKRNGITAQKKYPGLFNE